MHYAAVTTIVVPIAKAQVAYFTGKPTNEPKTIPSYLGSNPIRNFLPINMKGFESCICTLHRIKCINATHCYIHSLRDAGIATSSMLTVIWNLSYPVAFGEMMQSFSFDALNGLVSYVYRELETRSQRVACWSWAEEVRILSTEYVRRKRWSNTVQSARRGIKYTKFIRT